MHCLMLLGVLATTGTAASPARTAISTANVTALAVVPTGYLAGEGGTIVSYRTDGTVAFSLRTGQASVSRILVHPQGTYAVSIGLVVKPPVVYTAEVWNLRTKQRETSWNLPDTRCVTPPAVFTPTGNELVVGDTVYTFETDFFAVKPHLTLLQRPHGLAVSQSTLYVSADDGLYAYTLGSYGLKRIALPPSGMAGGPVAAAPQENHVAVTWICDTPIEGAEDTCRTARIDLLRNGKKTSSANLGEISDVIDIAYRTGGTFLLAYEPKDQPKTRLSVLGDDGISRQQVIGQRIWGFVLDRGTVATYGERGARRW